MPTTELHDAIERLDLHRVSALIEKYKASDTLADNLSTRDDSGKSPLLLAASNITLDINDPNDQSATIKTTSDIIELLLENGAHIYDMAPSSADTPLHYATMRNRSSIIRLFIEQGLDLKNDPNYRYFLNDICRLSRGSFPIEAIKTLIDAGVKIDEGHPTPLDRVVNKMLENSYALTQLLVANRANINAVNLGTARERAHNNRLATQGLRQIEAFFEHHRRQQAQLSHSKSHKKGCNLQ